MGSRTGKIDFVAELRLRQWARRNYVPANQRCDSDWHSIVLDEMRLIDQDHSATLLTTGIVTTTGPSTRESSGEDATHRDGRRTDTPHAGIPSPRLDQTDSTVAPTRNSSSYV